MNLWPDLSALRISLLLALFWASACLSQGAEEPPRHVLWIIADDASAHFGAVHQTPWVKAPNLERLAKEGLVLERCYTPTSKCAPSRAALLTGRHPWQLEEAANHQPYFPAKFTAFTEVLAASGLAVGSQGKTWGPGEAKDVEGRERNFGMQSRGAKGKGGPPGAAFAAFLRERKPGQPFFYWFGSANPHRPYRPNSGLNAGKKTSDIDRVPRYLPDHDVVRRDLLDYAMEVEAFDAEVGELLAALEQSGEAERTWVVVTSDHGMPFPRVKGHTFDPAHRVPMVMRLPDSAHAAGSRLDGFMSFVDVAPTLLAWFGLQAKAMAPISGVNLLPWLLAAEAPPRTQLVIGRERNDVLTRAGSPAGLGYPVRALRRGPWLYLHHFEPSRWPCGDPGSGWRDTDDSPTKALVDSLGEGSSFWQEAFGRRPQQQLFNVETDPDCVDDLAARQEQAALLKELHEALMRELQQQQDPRVLGQGARFDQYLSPRIKTAKRS